MLENLYTTKMSTDKKKLQNRFFKIRAGSGKLSKFIGLIVFAVILVIMAGVSIVIAVNTGDDYFMTENEFSEYIQKPVGAVMAELDYVDDTKLVFHYLKGFFVVNQKSGEIDYMINLNELNVAPHQQGDTGLEVKIDSEGKYAYLLSYGTEDTVKEFDSYIIDLKSGKVTKGTVPENTVLFTNYADTASAVDGAIGWYSNKCIVSGNKTYYLTTQDSIVAAIQLVTHTQPYEDLLDINMSYVFSKNYVSLSGHKDNLIKDSLAEGEEIIQNSGLKWEVDGETLLSVVGKLSEQRQMKWLFVGDDSYDIIIYQIQNKDKSYPKLFVIENSTLRLMLSVDIDKQTYESIVNLLNQPTEFYPNEIFDLKYAEIIVNNKKYPVLDYNTLPKIATMLSNAKPVKFATKCPFDVTLVVTRNDGQKGKITLAADSCAMFTSNGMYYDYSDGDNSEFLSYFGLDGKSIIGMLYELRRD